MPGTTAPTLVPVLLAPARRGPKPRLRDVPAGELARLIEEARRLVPLCARAYLGRGVPFDDLVGAGNVGVVEAAYRYDPDRGVKFPSYAMWWIRRGMSAAVERESNLVIVPRYSRERRRRVLEVLATRRDGETAPETHASIGAKLGLTGDQVERAMTCWSVMLSLDTPTRREGRTLGDDLAAPGEAEPDAVALSAEQWRRAGHAIAALSERQRAVLTLRYGLGDAEPARLSDISEVLGISRERVRQIENEALAQLRRTLARPVAGRNGTSKRVFR